MGCGVVGVIQFEPIKGWKDWKTIVVISNNALVKETIFIKLEYDASTAANFSKDISKPLLCSLKILDHWYHNIPEMGEPNISEDNFTRDAANLLKQDAFSEFYQADIHEFKSFEHQEIKMKLIVLKLIMAAMSFRN